LDAALRRSRGERSAPDQGCRPATGLRGAIETRSSAAGSKPTLSLVLGAAIIGALALSPALDAQRGGGDAAAGAAQRGGAAQGGAARGGGGRANANQPPAGPTPRLANGKPDLSGHWTNPYTANMAGGRGAGAVDPKTREPLQIARRAERFEKAPRDGGGNVKTFDLPYTELGLKRWLEYDPVTNGDYAGSCLPFGMSRSINSPHGVQLVHHPDALAFLFEQNTWHHWVPTKAGFKWPEDLPPTWNGVSMGRWDGDTLIVETRNFNGYTRLDTAGHPHSTSLTLINTFLRVDDRTIEHTVTVRDPKMYTQEWMNVRRWTLKGANDVLMEYSCDENNLDKIVDGSIKLWKPPDEVD
jgi:hypothetical protein